MPKAESSSMAGVRACAYLTTFIWAVTSRLVAALKRSVSRCSRPKARTSRAAERISLSCAGHVAELVLHLLRAFDDLLADVMHGQDRERHDGEADQHGRRSVRR